MKILIVSDTHGIHEYFKEVIRLTSPIDMLIHCGDTEGGEDYMRSLAGCRSEFIAGNNDFFSNLPREANLTIGKYKAMLVHGHDYGISMGYEPLLEEALSREADIVFFGHTHRPFLMRQKGVWLVNPGSLSFPRQGGRRPSFCIMDIDRFGEAHFTISYL